MGLHELFTWPSQTATQTASMPAVADEDLAADVDEPPDHGREQQKTEHKADFYKSTIRPQGDRKVSLLTQALHHPEVEAYKPEIHIATDLSRRRSMMSNASLASTAELTSDGGLTSPARTNTPSPPFPNTSYTSFAPFSMAGKTANPLSAPATAVKIKESPQIPEVISVSPKTTPPTDVVPKKRCITFACGGRKSPKSSPAPFVPQVAAPVVPTTEAPKRKCTIKFACGNPKPSDKPAEKPTAKPALVEAPKTPQSKTTESLRKSTSRSPSMTRKSARPPLASSTRSHRDSNNSIKTVSRSPLAVRHKPKYIIADEKTLQSSEATRFHEFASEQVEEDDWITKDTEIKRAKLTINDTLKKENEIRRLGSEAEAEAEEEDNEDDEDNQDENNSDNSDNEDGSDVDEYDDEDEDSIDEEASDGNETDNEAGFADSDDETDGEEDFAFWTPGRHVENRQIRDITHRPSAHRTASISSLDHEEPESRKKLRRQPMKIMRPGTPDLPDSTDFVCGTLDEDRPLEEAYVSCMEQRKIAKHMRTPQDIDPSFPTSDLEDEEDEHDILPPANDSDDHVWLHGKFEDSDEERQGRRRSTAGRRKSPGHSPKRLHSPPPPRRLYSPPPTKTRLRSPPPRKLFGHSPKRMRSPPPARTIRSPPASPSGHATTGAIAFAPLGSRPGLTHTKSLPRTPNAFCRQYHAARLIAANGNNGDESNDAHVRGAIDIVKGLEQKRQRRKEKFYQKQFARKHKPERKPQPGKGAERMEQLGLLLSGRTGTRDPFMMSA